MQLRHVKCVQPSQNCLARVAAVCWSPNNKRLAVADHNRFVHLFDESGERRDKFATKPGDAAAQRTYVIRAMCFSPDSTKVAIAQSDNIVFVYKLGLEWGDKKSICNKFQQPCGVTALVWPAARGSELVFGLADGKVRIGNLKTNRAQTLYGTDSPVVSLAGSVDGLGLISGHLDGALYRFFFDDGSGGPPVHSRIAVHPAVPYALAWGESIAAAGNDCKVIFYDRNGIQLQHFAYPIPEEKEFTCAAVNPSGTALVVGGWNKFRNFNYNPRQSKWEEGAVKECQNLLSVTALAWKFDGSRLVCASLCGTVDMFDACIRRHRYKGTFEFTYISPSQVIVKRLATGTRIVLKSQYAHEILKVNVYRDQFLVAHTDATLLVGDLASCKLSEIPWSPSGPERFFFDHPQLCMVHRAGELVLVEYGRHEVLGSCRTEYIGRHLLSVRLSEGFSDGLEDDRRRKIIAYLIDRQTIRILDLVTGIPLATVHHPCKVDWLELNKRATRLLFRDTQRGLFLHRIPEQETTTLLNYCSYAQWVPDSDVVVAQNRGDLCVWYSIDHPDRVALVPIKGDVEDIERAPGRTEVIVDEGAATVAYGLDESLIEFGAALDGADLDRACALLEQITLTPETEAMWQALSHAALTTGKLAVAERSFAALGDTAKALALARINRLAEQRAEEQRRLYHTDAYDGYAHYTVRAQVHVLTKDLKQAERILLEQGKVDEALEMWDELWKFDESIAVAEAYHHPDTEQRKEQYFQWLRSTQQEEKAAELLERERRYPEAVQLYLEGGLPARAAHVISTHGVAVPPQMLEAIASALLKAGMYEKAGDFFEKLQLHDRAIEAFKSGHCFRRAVELGRRVFPGYVAALEEGWGDWLVSQKQPEPAINHYIEANQYLKAIEAAITSRQWIKAIQIVEAQDPNDPITRNFYKLIAAHFEAQRQYAEAEKYYVKAGLRQEAVEMYTRNNLWDLAYKVAKQCMTEQEISTLYTAQAQQCELAGKYKDAERLYLKVNEPDMAIHMYKKAKQYDNMIRLVGGFRKELLFKTHQALAVQLEREGNLKQAEYHYVQAKDWQAAVAMYRGTTHWEDAIRVAKLHGGTAASKQVVFAWAVQLGGEQGARLLARFGLTEQAVEYALEAGQYEHAIELAQTSLKSKLPYVYIKHAMALEDDGRFREAEDAFLKAHKPREAVDMYVHAQDWVNAARVADTYDPTAIPDVLVAQARAAFEQKDFGRAEQLLLKASRPELLLKIYREARMWTDAQRIARDYCPEGLQEVNEDYARWLQQSGGDSRNPLEVAKLWVESGDYPRAIDAYMRVSEEFVPDAEERVKAWETAVRMASSHCKPKLSEALAVVSRKMLALKRHKAAAKLFEDLEMWEDAVDMYIAGADWDKAQALADRLSPIMAERVRLAQREALMQQGSAQALYEAGNHLEALEVYRNAGDWAALMPKARLEDRKTRQHYSALYIRHLLPSSDFREAAMAMIEDGVSEDVQHLETYMDAVRGLITLLPVDFDVMPIRDHLYHLAREMRLFSDVVPMEELSELVLVTHHYAYSALAKRVGLRDVSAKLLVALLRHPDVVPADKGFHDAGVAAKEVGWNNVAFVLLNRFVDIVEMIDDGEFDSTALDASDFTATDFPTAFPMPRKPVVPTVKVEDVRQWVLTASLDKTVERRLPTVPCPQCVKPMFEGALRCPHCAETFEPCVVTGYPILRPADRVQCKACKAPANERDWRLYLAKLTTCPACGNQPE